MNIKSVNRAKACESCIRIISKYLPKSEYEYLIRYGGTAIEIVGKDENNFTRLYLRIIEHYQTGEITVDLSNITLDPRLRRKGIFTNIVNNLKLSRSINSITVSSVLTPEMHKVCRKLGMEADNNILGYRFNLR